MLMCEIMEMKWLETHDTLVWRVKGYYPPSNQTVYFEEVFGNVFDAHDAIDEFQKRNPGFICTPYLAES